MDIRTFTKRYFMASIKQDGILKALRKGIKQESATCIKECRFASCNRKNWNPSENDSIVRVSLQI